MIKKENRNKTRKVRHIRVRKKVVGSTERPRLNVYRSAIHIYAQVIDDQSGHTLVSASTMDKDLKDKVAGKPRKEAARMVGKLIGQRAIEHKIKTVVFDRGGYIYHGRVQELAEGAREAGLDF